jgi:uncharacterized protein YdgA (DUF945 family)
VKKGIVVLLVVLALLVIVAPGIVGMLAEKSVHGQIESAERDNQDLMVTAESFDRGWFSSQGRHRIAFREDEAMPAIIVDTTLNHGPIALASAGEKGGSLMPGLGNAVSTLSIERPDGELVELPGAVYSALGLGGDLRSTYVAEAGESDAGSWSDIEINYESTAASGNYVYDGQIASLELVDGEESVAISNLTFSGDMTRSDFGFAIGAMKVANDSVAVATTGQPPVSIGPLSLETSSVVDGGRINSTTALAVSVDEIPGVGPVALDMQMDVEGIDGAALQRLVQKMQSVRSTGQTDMGGMLDAETADLLAAGAELHIRRLNVTLPQGTVKSQLDLAVQETDGGSAFEWSSLLLATEADLKLEVPEVLADMAMMMAPNAALIEGFLIKNGDVYELDAAYKKGLMTVNGMPLAIPLQ